MSVPKQNHWSESPLINNDGDGNSFSVLVKKITNSPLPWFGLLALIVIFMTAQSYQAKDIAELAKQTAWKAETESMMLREHVDSLRMELAVHGIMPPPLPKCLVENTPCQIHQ
jgi:hypothetical protein